MKKIAFVILTTMVIAGVMISCSKKAKPNAAEAKTKDSTDYIVKTDSIINEDDSVYTGKSLNDIRFANFDKEEDWYDNEYIRTLRKYIDSFNKGQIEDDILEPYRKKIIGKFIVVDVQPFLCGGLLVRVIFIDNPNYLFTAWIYSEVDEEKESISGYFVRDFSHEETEVTKEQVLQAINEHPELKLW